MNEANTQEAQKRIEDQFPDILKSGYNITSPVTDKYNCIAWAAGCDDAWWEAAAGYYWPDGVPHDQSVIAVQKLYEKAGYCVCSNDNLEVGFEKVAIYADKFGYTHAARQLKNGKWTSKLGNWEDIEHSSLAGLESDFYGRAVQFLKREIRLI